MKILAFDTTAKIASVAVTDGERALADYSINNGLTQSELILPMAENMLKSLGISFSDIELLAATVGPGSFTGVRIGAALVKGIAFDRNIPCVEVSTLESLAENLAPLGKIIVPCMDARRSQVYNAIFSSDGEKLTRLTPDRAISLDELAEELKEFDGERIYLSGDGYEIAHKRLSEIGVRLERTPALLIEESAVSCAKVAYRKFLAGEVTSDERFTPSYLRLPQAERERLERLENKKIKDKED